MQPDTVTELPSIGSGLLQPGLTESLQAVEPAMHVVDTPFERVLLRCTSGHGEFHLLTLSVRLVCTHDEALTCPITQTSTHRQHSRNLRQSPKFVRATTLR